MGGGGEGGHSYPSWCRSACPRFVSHLVCLLCSRVFLLRSRLLLPPGGGRGKRARLTAAAAPSHPAPHLAAARGDARGGVPSAGAPREGGRGGGGPAASRARRRGRGPARAGRCRAGQRGGLGGGRGAARRGFASHFGFSLQSTGEPLRGREASSRLRGRVREERGKEPARGIPARHPGAVRIPARRVPPRAWAGQLESPLLPGAPVAQEDALGAGGGRPPAAVRG